MHYLIFSVPISRPFFAASLELRQILIKNLFIIDVHVAGKDFLFFEWSFSLRSDFSTPETDAFNITWRHCTQAASVTSIINSQSHIIKATTRQSYHIFKWFHVS